MQGTVNSAGEAFPGEGPFASAVLQPADTSVQAASTPVLPQAPRHLCPLLLIPRDVHFLLQCMYTQVPQATGAPQCLGTGTRRLLFHPSSLPCYFLGSLQSTPGSSRRLGTFTTLETQAQLPGAAPCSDLVKWSYPQNQPSVLHPRPRAPTCSPSPLRDLLTQPLGWHRL